MGKIKDLNCFDESVSQSPGVVGVPSKKTCEPPRLANWPPVFLDLTMCLMLFGSIGRNIGCSYGAVPYANSGAGRPARQIDSVSLVLWQDA